MALVPSLENLREILIEEMGDLLGTYQLPNKTTVPAVAVDDKGKFPPAKTIIEGLEVVVIPITGLGVTPLNNGRTITYQSQITLKQWDASKDTVAATLKLIEILGTNRVSLGPRLLPNNSIGNIETITLTFTQTQLQRAK